MRMQLFVCAMLFAGSAAAQSPPCSLASFNGNYIFKDYGEIALLGTYASAGSLTANGNGAGAINNETVSLAGTISTKSTSIAYSLAPGATVANCQFSVATGDGRNFTLYLKPNGSKGTFIATALTQTINGEIEHD
jgi:archaellum component FlaG (FlaF/FlaG flagellin family)